MTASVAVLVPLFLYMLVLLVLGLWSRSSGDSLEGYFLAGKKLPSWVVAFSANATGESGWLLLGLTGMGYAVGFHALWVVLGEALGVALAWTVIARRFKAYTDRYGAITVPDYLEARFPGSVASGQWLRKVSLVVILSMVAVYCSAQLVASGKAFATFLGIPYVLGVLVGLAVTMFYTAVGGFKAVAYSDLVQGLLMAAGLVLLPVAAFAAAGGWTPVIETLRADDPTLLLAMGHLGVTPTGIASAASFGFIGLAFLGVPQLLVRFMSARSGRDIRHGGLIAVVCVLVFDFGAVLTGIAGRALHPGLLDPETIMPQLSDELFPALVTGVFLVIVLGAIMSTVDSLLILASSAVVRDFFQKILHTEDDPQLLARWGRYTTAAIGLAALPLALLQPPLLFWFVLFAWSGLAAAFLPPVLLSLWWPRISREGALAGMVTGFVTTVAWVLVWKDDTANLYELIPGFIVGMAFAVAVSLLTRAPEGAAEEMDEVRASLAGDPQVPATGAD